MGDSFLDKLLNTGSKLYETYVESKTSGNKNTSTPPAAPPPTNYKPLIIGAAVVAVLGLFLVFRKP